MKRFFTFVLFAALSLIWTVGFSNTDVIEKGKVKTELSQDLSGVTIQFVNQEFKYSVNELKRSQDLALLFAFDLKEFGRFVTPTNDLPLLFYSSGLSLVASRGPPKIRNSI